MILTMGRELAGADHLTVIRFDGLLQPHVVLSISGDGSTTALRAGERYCQSPLNVNDPIRNLMIPGSDDGVIISRLAIDGMLGDPLRTATYRAMALAERWSILGNSGGDWITVNLYRGEATLPPSGAEDRLIEQAPLLHALVMSHLRMVMPPAHGGELFTTLVARLRPTLSPRQQQVCVRALFGMTNAEIATDLGIGSATVSTLRRRAYHTLEISSLAELFSRCLADHHGQH